MATYLVLHGPNLNLLGSREPELYGSQTLDDINAGLVEFAANGGHDVHCLQSNAEHVLVDAIHAAKADCAGVLINPGAFGHTSIAIRDALLGVSLPFVEVHLSNVYAREAFRRETYLSDIALGVITGLRANGYRYGLDYLIEATTES